MFFCFGHGKSKAFLAEHEIPSHVKIIDLAQDFRIAGEHDYTYGLPETHREAIRSSRHLANPGCFATCIQLGLLPALKAGIISGDIHTNGITGKDRAPEAGCHHPLLVAQRQHIHLQDLHTPAPAGDQPDYPGAQTRLRWTHVLHPPARLLCQRHLRDLLRSLHHAHRGGEGYI